MSKKKYFNIDPKNASKLRNCNNPKVIDQRFINETQIKKTCNFIVKLYCKWSTKLEKR